MKRKNDGLVALLGAVLCVCTCLVGCERNEGTPSEPSSAPPAQPAATSVVSRAEVQVRSTTASIEERARDAAYQAQLAGFEKDRRRIRKRRAEIEAKMARLREYAKAKKGLPSDAKDEQVEAALDGAPLRAWRELVAARKAGVAEEEKSYAAAQAAVARRISRKEEQSEDRAQGAAPAEK